MFNKCVVRPKSKYDAEGGITKGTLKLIDTNMTARRQVDQARNLFLNFFKRCFK